MELLNYIGIYFNNCVRTCGFGTVDSCFPTPVQHAKS